MRRRRFCATGGIVASTNKDQRTCLPDALATCANDIRGHPDWVKRCREALVTDNHDVRIETAKAFANEQNIEMNHLKWFPCNNKKAALNLPAGRYLLRFELPKDNGNIHVVALLIKEQSRQAFVVDNVADLLVLQD